jgi:hypothetical protein
MAVDDVYLALVALDDPDKAERVAAGDWSALGDLELTDEEHEMVADLVEERAADVAGFSSPAFFRTVSYSRGVSPGLLQAYPAQQFSFGQPFEACGSGACGGVIPKKMPGGLGGAGSA